MPWVTFLCVAMEENSDGTWLMAFSTMPLFGGSHNYTM